VVPATVIAVLVGTAAPGLATATPADKPAVLADWTRPTLASYRAWSTARRYQDDWAPYGFDWSTDYCTGGPDQPGGFDFRLPCARHDFGYRNYRAAGTLAANRYRLDRMLYADLSRECTTQPLLLRAACVVLAWTYYRLVRRFGGSGKAMAARHG